ncbi:hypothetical protein EVA_10775 [gut metagenome]|uniref:Uncharacterized protein n=1 Tax=gut metagenome TaxID=749906 RepID=J9GH13_9ZZZZ
MDFLFLLPPSSPPYYNAMKNHTEPEISILPIFCYPMFSPYFFPTHSM